VNGSLVKASTSGRASSARSSTAPTSTGVTAEEQAAAQVAALWPTAASGRLSLAAVLAGPPRRHRIWAEYSPPAYASPAEGYLAHG
jgi:hypothetical protein